MKYESVKLLFQQDKYVQIVSMLVLLVFGYSIYHMSTSLTKSIDSNVPRQIYEVHTGNVTVRNEIYSGKSWVLSKCLAASDYCWKAIN